MRGLARLVVLDDPARAERVDVDPVDLPGEREAVDLEPALELGRRAVGAERDLELARDEAERRLGLLAHEVLQVAPEALLELAPLEVAELDPDAALDRLGQALAEELERLVEPLRVDAARRRVRFGRPEKNLNSAWCATEPRRRASTSPSIVRGRITRSMNQIDEQSAKRLELGHAEGRPRAELVEQHRVGELRRPRECAARPLEAPLPAVRVREGVRLVLVARRERGQRAQPLALGRRRVDPPRELRRAAGASSSGRRRSASKSARASSQNGLGSRGEPSSVAASRTR